MSSDIHFVAHNIVLTVDPVIDIIDNMIPTVGMNKDITHMIAPTTNVF